MREPREQRAQGGDGALDLAEQLDAAGGEHTGLRFDSNGALPPVGDLHHREQPTASDRAFGHGAAYIDAGTAAAPATRKGKPKPTFTTLSGTQVEKTTSEEAQVLNELRKSPLRFDPAWLVQAQTTLGVVDATGAMNTETLRRLREHAKSEHLSAPEILDVTFLHGIAAGQPFLASEEGFEHEQANATATTPADRAAQAAGYEDYKSYRGTFEFPTFLGVSLKQGKSDGSCHPYLAARLRAAEAFLRARHSGKDDAAVRKAIGWNGAGGLAYETSSEFIHGRKDAKDPSKNIDPMSHQHTMGLAIDIDPGNNPYIFQGDAGDTVFAKHLPIAAKLFGGQALTAGWMANESERTSTEELHATIDKSSNAVRAYLQLASQSDDVIEKKLATKFGDQAKDMVAGVKRFEAWFHAGGGRDNAQELTNISMELLVALRDAAGLSWGGTEMSHTQNGDFMHFDCRNTALGHAVYTKLSPADEKQQQEQEAARKAKPYAKKK